MEAHPSPARTDLRKRLLAVANASEQWAGYVVKPLSMTHADLARLLREAAAALAAAERARRAEQADRDDYKQSAEANRANYEHACRMRERAERERDALREALENFLPGANNGEWGRYLAWIVEGAPTRAEGIAAAQQINQWRAALARLPAAEEQE